MNLQELTAYVVNYMKRNDLAAVMPQFVAIAEASINATLRTDHQVVHGLIDTAIPPVREGSYPLPSDFLEMRDVYYASDGRQVGLKAVGSAELKEFDLSGGKPQVYTIMDGEIQIRPVPGGQVIGLTYFGTLPPLVAPTDTNNVLTIYPNIYLSKVLAEAHRSVQDYEAAAGETGMGDREIRAANLASSAARVGSAPSVSKGYNFGKSRSYRN